MTLLERLKYRWLGLTRGTRQLRLIKEAAIRQLIGHTRIIGWEDGLPVRSLTIPAEYSSASTHAMARLYNSLRPGTRSPGLVTFSVTNRCDCECPHCFAAGQEGEELPLGTWQSVIEQSVELGAFTFIISGGEPLLREDLAEMIRHIDWDYATALVYTNGSRLAERVDELYEAGLRRISVAIDFADPEKHDAHRHYPGLFQKALVGLRKAQDRGKLVGLSTFASPARLADGTLAGIFELGQELGVNEIAVYDLLPVGRWDPASDPGTGSREYRDRFREFVSPWWEREDAPGVWWYGHVTSPMNLGCPGGSTMLNISHRGAVRPCDFCRTAVGSVLEEDLVELWRKLGTMSRRHRESSGGCMVQTASTPSGASDDPSELATGRDRS